MNANFAEDGTLDTIPFIPIRGDDFVYGIRQLRKENRDFGAGGKRALKEVLRWRRENDLLTPKPAGELRLQVFATRYWEHECGFKQAYQELAPAVQHARGLRLIPRDSDKEWPLTVYRCRWCDWLHVGHDAATSRFPKADTIWTDGGEL